MVAKGTNTKYSDKYGKPIKIGDYVQHEKGEVYKVIEDRLVNTRDLKDFKTLTMIKEKEYSIVAGTYIPPKNVFRDKNGEIIKEGEEVLYRNNPYIVKGDTLLANNGSTRELYGIERNYLLVVKKEKEETETPVIESSVTIADFSSEDMIAELKQRGAWTTTENLSDDSLLKELKKRGYYGELSRVVSVTL